MYICIPFNPFSQLLSPSLDYFLIEIVVRYFINVFYTVWVVSPCSASGLVPSVTQYLFQEVCIVWLHLYVLDLWLSQGPCKGFPSCGWANCPIVFYLCNHLHNSFLYDWSIWMYVHINEPAVYNLLSLNPSTTLFCGCKLHLCCPFPF